MAQNPESTEYDGMPAQHPLPPVWWTMSSPAEMPASTHRLRRSRFGRPPRPATVPTPKTENRAEEDLRPARAQTGHDFSQYKPSTINRRIERRMAVHQIETMDGYVKYLQQDAGRGGSALRDLLIGVTSFFRDPEAFKAIEEQVIPKLFAASAQTP